MLHAGRQLHPLTAVADARRDAEHSHRSPLVGSARLDHRVPAEIRWYPVDGREADRWSA